MKVRFFAAKYFCINLVPTFTSPQHGEETELSSDPGTIPGTYVYLILKTGLGTEDVTLILDSRSLALTSVCAARLGSGPRWIYLQAVNTGFTGQSLHFFSFLNSFLTNLPLAYICAVSFYYYLNCDLGKAEFC